MKPYKVPIMTYARSSNSEAKIVCHRLDKCLCNWMFVKLKIGQLTSLTTANDGL